MLARLPHLLSLSLLALPPALAAAAELELSPVQISGSQTSGSYGSTQASVASFSETAARDTPAQVSVFNQALLADQQARLLSDVLLNDASVSQAYAPIGYYQNFLVRGFSLNAASSYKINGRTVTGEQPIALENKQQVELLKGLSALQTGVAEPGGLVNYVTKRSEQVRTLNTALNSQGGRYLALDVGDWFGTEQQFGARLNLAHEEIDSYVKHTDGRRDFASLALDWNINARSSLQVDIEYQQRQQPSAPGYQLLNGNQLPHAVDPEDLLARQRWAKPVAIDAWNLGARYDYRLSDDWNLRIAASRSRVVIDDYSSFAYGCWGCGGNDLFFGPNGDYDIYDFRSPDDTRQTDDAELALSGQFKLAGMQHHLELGLSAMRRTLDYREPINEWVGAGNIYQPTAPVAPYQGALNPRQERLDSRQYGLFIQDRIQLNSQWQAVLGGRQVRLDENGYDASGQHNAKNQRHLFLPQLALIYQATNALSLYGSYSEGVSFGRQAHWFANNAGQTLSPVQSEQWEAGLRYEWQRASFSAALFRLEQDLQYSRPDAFGGYDFIAQGQQRNTGLEFNFVGQLSERLQLQASLATIRARLYGSGYEPYEGHQALNVPKVRASVQTDYQLPGIDGLAILAGVQYSSSKYASHSASAKAPGYQVFHLGGRYQQEQWALRLTVDNLFNEKYWRDAGDYLGDGYLFLGEPRTLRLSASVDF